MGEKVICRWSMANPPETGLEHYQLLHLLIDDGQSMVLVPAEVERINDAFIEMRLPEKSFCVGERQARRYVCKDITAELRQNGFTAQGSLIDFNAFGFRVRVKPESGSFFHWFNPELIAALHLRERRKISGIFSGPCRCLRQEEGSKEREIVLVPAERSRSRFRKSAMRNPRQRLIPQPVVTAYHPVLGREIEFEVFDISNGGLSVYQKSDEAVLFSGLMIPELNITFAGELQLQCKAQVVYCSKPTERGTRCGLAILDMDMHGYSRL
jgi:hypothetical protein